MHSTRQKNRTTILPLAVTVGLLVFFVTVEMPGGLTGLQGFFVGFGAVFALIFLLALLSRRRPPTQLEDVTIAETDEEITIRIRLDQLGHVQATSRR